MLLFDFALYRQQHRYNVLDVDNHNEVNSQATVEETIAQLMYLAAVDDETNEPCRRPGIL